MCVLEVALYTSLVDIFRDLQRPCIFLWSIGGGDGRHKRDSAET